MKDITNQKFNRLTAIKFIKKEKGQPYWLFRCKCGKKKFIRYYDVLYKKTQSCGCWNIEINKIIHRIHGMSKTRFDSIFGCINTRTKNKNRPEYFRYGARGIKNEWVSFEDFYKDMYESYIEHVKQFGEKNTQIDRINNNKGYSKKNCRWVTLIEQANNKRNNKFLIYKGQKLTVSEWARKLNLYPQTLYTRLKKYSVKKAFTMPIRTWPSRIQKSFPNLQ